MTLRRKNNQRPSEFRGFLILTRTGQMGGQPEKISTQFLKISTIFPLQIMWTLVRNTLNHMGNKNTLATTVGSQLWNTHNYGTLRNKIANFQIID
jgi:hypothetical protein